MKSFFVRYLVKWCIVCNRKYKCFGFILNYFLRHDNLKFEILKAYVKIWKTS